MPSMLTCFAEVRGFSGSLFSICLRIACVGVSVVHDVPSMRRIVVT